MSKHLSKEEIIAQTKLQEEQKRVQEYIKKYWELCTEYGMQIQLNVANYIPPTPTQNAESIQNTEPKTNSV